MRIRPARRDDLDAWCALRARLWPDGARTHRGELEAFFAGTSIDIEQALVAEADDGGIAGFLELNIRNFAEGSRRPRVPYVEAWYVEPAFRRQGLGAAFMDAAEAWARAQGYEELASDTTPDNELSIALHRKLGFEETERVVCLLKRLGPG